jgi:oxalate decarboxylase/phosphoglucose isomerase-like protein (cupin superfamily)
LTAGLVEENGNSSRVITNTVKQGTTVALPQGLIHFVQNEGCEEVQFLATFNNRDAGSQTTFVNLLRLPDSVLRGTLNVDDDVIAMLRDANSAPVGGFGVDPVCAKKCGLPGF